MQQSFEKPVLALDFDFVIASIGEGSLRACSALSGITHVDSYWGRYDMFREYGLTIDEYLKALIDHRVLETANILPGASNALTLAREHGFDVAVITARGFHPEGESITLAWAERHGIHIDQLHLVEAEGSKAHIIKSMRNVVAYVDDLPGHLCDLRSAGVDVPLFLMDQPWNKDCSDFPRVTSLLQYVQVVFDLQEKNNHSHRKIAP